MATAGNLSVVQEEGSSSNNPNPDPHAHPDSSSRHRSSVPGTPPAAPVPTITKELDTGKFGKVKVHIQGDLSKAESKAVFLTVHDIGANHNTFRDFVDHPCMCEVKARSVFIHLDLPGQEDNGADLPDEFVYPSINSLGEDLVTNVLDQLQVKLVVGVGEGAGANILVRFALRNPQRVLGLVLIHLVSAGVGMLERLKDQFFSGKRRPSQAPTPDQIISLHKLGHGRDSNAGDSLLIDYAARAAKISAKNLRKYAESYMNRKELPMMENLDILLIVGGKSPYLQGVQTIHGDKADKSKSQLLKIDGVVDVLGEAPEKTAQSILLFVKGLGFLTSLTLPGVERQRTFSGESGGEGEEKTKLGAIGRRRTLSMEEYDAPRLRRLSLTNANANSTTTAPSN